MPQSRPHFCWSPVRLTAALVIVLAGCSSNRGDGLRHVDLDRAEAKFQQTLDSLRDEFHFPGATAAFILDDGRVGAAATGYADLEREVPMTTDTRMLSGSIGKTFVAAVALELAHEDVLDLDSPISEWLGAEPWFDRLANHDDITMRHLLTHSGGMIDHVYEPQFAEAVSDHVSASDADPDWHYTPEELVQFTLDKQPLFEPGRGYSYTDTGYILAGMVIERVAGESYYEILQQRFLDPLELTNTAPADTRELNGLASGYQSEDNPFALPAKIAENGVLRVHPATEWTGGGLITNPQDLVRWAKVLYEENAMPGYYLEALLESGYHGIDGKHTYGLGVDIEDSQWGESYGHGGWFPGYNSAMYYYPKYGFAVAIQVNTSSGNEMDVYVDRLARVIARQLGVD